MEWDEQDRVVHGDIRQRWDVSDSTLRRHRKTEKLTTGERDANHRWTFDRLEVEAHAIACGWSLLREANSHLTRSPEAVDQAVTTVDQAVTTAEMIELGDLRARLDATDTAMARLTAERDRARSDHEQEHTRAEAAEREAIEHRTSAQERRAVIADLQNRLDQAHNDVLHRLEALEAVSGPTSPPQHERAVAAPSMASTSIAAIAERLRGWVSSRRWVSSTR